MRKAVLVFMFLLLYAAAALAQPRLANYASGSETLSPGALAIITGAPLATVAIDGPLAPARTQLGGLSVRFDGYAAGVVSARPGYALILVPDYLPDNNKPVEVVIDSVFGTETTYTRLARTSPGLFQQAERRDDWADARLVPVGMYRLGYSLPLWIGATHLPPSTWQAKTAVQLFGTGFRFAQATTIWINGRAFPCEWGTLANLPGNDAAGFYLPDGITGDVEIVLEADGRRSNAVRLQIADLPMINTGATIPARTERRR